MWSTGVDASACTPKTPWQKLPAPRPGRRGGRAAPAIRLPAEERAQLERLVRAGSSEQRLVRRARIVLLADEGLQSVEIARQLVLSENTVGLWRRRYLKSGPAGLKDAPRSGRPSPFTPEQRAQVIQKAIEESPSDNGLPFTHWSAKDLTRIARESGIVASIHPSTV